MRWYPRLRRVWPMLQQGGGTPTPTPTPGPDPLAFDPHPSTTALVSALETAGDAPSIYRQLTYDTMFRRLDAAGLLSKIIAAYLPANTEAGWQVNIMSPGSYTLAKVGTPTFVPNVGVSTSSASDYYDTGLSLAALYAAAGNSLTNHSLMAHARGLSPANNLDCGAINGSSQGLALGLRIAAEKISARSMSTSSSAGGSIAQGDSWGAVVRTESPTYGAYQNGTRKMSPSTAPAAALASDATTLTILKAAGSPTWCNGVMDFFAVGLGMTDDEYAQAHAIFRTALEAIKYGDLDMRPAAEEPATISAYDHVIYGHTAQGITAAHALARAGKKVCIVGGWRDHPGSLGGMTANGLGEVDVDSVAVFQNGGIAWDMFKWCRDLDSAGDTTSLRVVPQHFRWSVMRLLSAAHGGYQVPIYYTRAGSTPGGVVSVSGAGTRVNSMTTADGRTFAARYFYDASFEGDLLRVCADSGFGSVKPLGREAAGSGSESVNGYRGTSTAATGGNNQMTVGGSGVTVDPFVTPGDPGSGLIAGVTAAPALSVGDADPLIQAFCFRISMAPSATGRHHPLPSAAPDGYAASDYEVLFRLMGVASDASTKVEQADVFKFSSLSAGSPTALDIYDINNGGGFSSDIYIARDYLTASYEGRETYWKQAEQRIRGLIYAIRYDTDARAAAQRALGVGTAAYALSFYGLAGDHYLWPDANDSLHWPGQLYVRQGYLPDGDITVDANDLTMTDGGTPTKSTRIITQASYVMDMHHNRRIAAEIGGVWKVWNSGNVQAVAGGTNKRSPVPLEAFLFKQAECDNVASLFGASATGIAFGSIRMELTTCMAAESIAVIGALADEGNIGLGAVDYADFTAALDDLGTSRPNITATA